MHSNLQHDAMATTWKSNQGIRKKTIDLWRRSNCMQDLFEKRIIELATLDPSIFLKHLDGILIAL
ncbi:MAG: hypothetical protein IPL26_26350 [Leptospiraceae bacterium]|nr:hypothetical protein [Leptospiraceae bacterium]